MTRRPPTDYLLVWVADVTKRGHGVFHIYREEYRRREHPRTGGSHLRMVRPSCGTRWTPYEAAMVVLGVPITWAHELGFRPCRKCKWPDWVLRKYGEGVS